MNVGSLRLPCRHRGGRLTVSARSYAGKELQAVVQPVFWPDRTRQPHNHGRGHRIRRILQPAQAGQHQLSLGRRHQAGPGCRRGNAPTAQCIDRGLDMVILAAQHGDVAGSQRTRSGPWPVGDLMPRSSSADTAGPKAFSEIERFPASVTNDQFKS